MRREREKIEIGEERPGKDGGERERGRVLPACIKDFLQFKEASRGH